jgi:molybdenum cofactor cytidylyltransferase
MTKAAGLVLAAGTSTRMGRPKQLLQVGGVSLLDRLLQETLHSDLDLLVLVIGHAAQEIREALVTDLSHPKIRVVENGRYREGISTSIIAGLSEVEEGHDHVMILLADMPHITAGLINLLLSGYLDSRLPLGAVCGKSGRSHPVIISRRFYREIHSLSGDRGARDLFAKHAGQVFLVEPEGGLQERDIDTEEDYISFRDCLERNP